MNKDELSTFKDIQRKYGLEYKGRFFFSNDELRKLKATIEQSEELRAGDWTSFTEIICPTNFPPQKRAMLNQNKQLTEENQILKLDVEGEGNNQRMVGLSIKNKFFVDFFKKAKTDYETNTLSDEDKFDEQQGFLNFTPKSAFSQTMIELERITRDNSFSNDRIKIVNGKNFTEVKCEADTTYNMTLPKRMKISIELEKTSRPIAEATYYELEKDDYTYSSTATELKFIQRGVLPDNWIEDDAERKRAMIPVKALADKPAASIPLYLYSGVLHFEDGKTRNLDVVSFVPLRQTFYDVYGYLNLGDYTSELYVKVLQVIELENANVSPDEIFVKHPQREREHRYWQFYRFCTEYLNKHKVPLHKKKSDTLIWMEVLKTLVHFGIFDSMNRCHGIYAGFQDVGKTYIAESFNSMRWPSPKTVMPGRISVPGMFGGSNQTLRLPDREIKNHPIPGFIEHPSILIEEVGNDIVNPNAAEFRTILEIFKGCLFKDIVEASKVGSGTSKRNAIIQMTMNYTNSYKSALRAELMKIAEAIESDFRQGKTAYPEFGEQGSNLLADQPRTKSGILREMVNKKDIFANIKSFPTDAYFDTELNMDVNKVDAVLFQKAIVSFREVKEKNQIDMATSLPFPVMKRLPFSVFGGINETFIDRTEKDEEEELKLRDLRRKDVSFLKSYKQLYIPNLREVISGHMIAFANEIDYYNNQDVVADLNYYAKKLYYFLVKKHPVFKKTGEDTNEDILSMIMNTLMFINRERVPSLETCQIIEKWMILQSTPITTMEAKSYTRMQQFIDKIGVMNQEMYDKLFAKDVKKNVRE